MNLESTKQQTIYYILYIYIYIYIYIYNKLSRIRHVGTHFHIGIKHIQEARLFKVLIISISIKIQSQNIPNQNEMLHFNLDVRSVLQ